MVVDRRQLFATREQGDLDGDEKRSRCEHDSGGGGYIKMKTQKHSRRAAKGAEER